MCPSQVTNRDLSIAVLRKFLPQLAQELTDGTLKRKLKTLPPRQNAAAAGQVRAGFTGLMRHRLRAVLQQQLAVNRVKTPMSPQLPWACAPAYPSRVTQYRG